MRRPILLLTFLAAMLFACTGVVLAQSTSPDPSKRPSGEGHDHRHVQGDHDHQLGPKTTKSGIFSYITGGETPSGDHEHQVEYSIVDEQGRETKLQLTDQGVLQEALKDLGVSKEQLRDGGPQPLVGKRVTIQGRWTSHDAEGERGSDANKIKVESIQNAPSGDEESKFDFEADPAVTGSKPAVTIACKYADNTAEPKTISYFNSLVGGTTKPGIDHFWREASYNQINLSGSQVVGWYTLPKTRAQYLNSDGSANLGLLAQDCTAVADNSVFFPNYSTINLMFNGEIDGSAWGGYRPMTLDGQTITYGMTWMPPWGYGNVGILGHEMGHSYGLPHSSGPYGQTYDSWWDVMSSGGLLNPSSIGRTDCFRDATYGCMAMHTISAHKDKLGWIPTAQRYTAASGSQQTITIDRLGTATSTSGNYLMARIPIGGSTTQFYTVEARRPVGYDAHAAADGLVIHKIDTSQAVGLTRFAYVVDSDNNGNPNDAGAAWVPGETFTDSVNSVSIQVTGSTTNGYTVRIQNGGSTAPANDSFASAQELTGATTTGTNAGATKETGEPNHAGNSGGKSVWYRWTPQASGTATIDTAGSSFDTLLAVYTGGAVNALTGVASNDDDVGTTSKVSFSAAAGTTYRIAVDGYNGASGNVNLNLAAPASNLQTFQENDRDHTQYGDWFFWKDTSLNGGYAASSNVKGSAATFVFTGTNVTWKTTKHPENGITAVYLDGVKQPNFNGYSATAQSDVTGFSASGLANTRHTLRLVVTGAKSAGATGTFTDVDRFVVGTQSFRENHPRVIYDTWRGTGNTNASGGAYRQGRSASKPAYFYYFSGPQVDLVTAKGPSRGTATVTVVDAATNAAARQVTLNLNAPTEQWQVRESITGLDPAKRYYLYVLSSDGKPAPVDAFGANLAQGTQQPADERGVGPLGGRGDRTPLKVIE